MTSYLFIESRDNFDHGADGGFCATLAPMLAANGSRVSVLLVQNGVLMARSGAHGPGIAALLGAGVGLFADEFSLRERGIARAQLASGIESTELDIVIDRLADGWQVIWH